MLRYNDSTRLGFTGHDKFLSFMRISLRSVHIKRESKLKEKREREKERLEINKNVVQ